MSIITIFRLSRQAPAAALARPAPPRARHADPSLPPTLPLASHGHGHKHDSSVTSVGITYEGEMDMNVLNQWLSTLLQTKGADIYRSKGILAIKGSPDKWVFQGVHMMMGMSNSSEGVVKPWAADEKRVCKVVFIGKKLDRQELTDGFLACAAK